MSRENISQDERIMRETFRLARKGMSWTNPNPLVGAVVVKRGVIVARGYHTRVGAPHAEIEALRVAGKQAKEATLYVNLEPCSHWGKTPPCVNAIIESKIKKVVCCSRDPHKVARGGIEKLKRAGIAVSVGLLKQAAQDLNEAFFTFHESNRPFVAIKFAASLDGKIATHTGDSKWITNGRARVYARALRGTCQAVMVGINTVLKDDSHLGVRAKGKKDPLRIVLDSRLRIPLGAHVLRDSNVLIVTTGHANVGKKRSLAEKGIEIVEMGNRIEIKALMRELYKREIISVLVEGGGSILGSFLDAHCVDKVYAFHAPILIGGEGAKNAIGGTGASSIRQAFRLTRVKRKMFGDDMLVSGYLSAGSLGRHQIE